MKRRDVAGVVSREQDALAWYVTNRDREESLDDSLIRRWATWWEAEENQSAYTAIVELGEQAKSLTRPGSVTDEELRRDWEAISTHEAMPVRVPVCALDRPRKPSIGRSGPWLASVAGVAASIALIAGMMLFQAHLVPPGRNFETAPGEQRSFTLEDGSIMTLGGDTAVTVRFTAAGRMLVLSRGEGMFRVHRDTDRPFAVCAASGCTTAVGTIFDVRLYSTHTRVWVQEGAVLVEPRAPGGKLNRSARDPSSFQPVQLEPAQELRYAPDGYTSGATPLDPATAAAWTSGSLVYFSRPLGEVIEDVQRYTPRRLVISPEAALRLYSGSILQEHIQQWLRGLSRVFPIETIDCQDLEQSIGSDSEEIIRSCSSDPTRILIRSR